MSPIEAARVLVIDDNESVRRALARQLERLGFLVEQAASGSEGLALIGTTRPDAILLDLRMPGMDGHAFLRCLGSSSRPPAVVVMSGAGTMEDVIEAIRAGASGFIQKPWTRDSLTSALSRALGDHSRTEVLQADTAPPAGDFQALLTDYDPETLAADPGVIIGIWADFRIAYYNPAYLSFAADNGAPDLASKYGLGSSLLDALDGPVREFYVEHLRRVLAGGLPWQHDYACDSPTIERNHRLIAMPLGKQGLLLIHSLRVVLPLDRDIKQLIDDDYRDPEGLIIQCCQCRRLRRTANILQWDFVPAALEAEMQQGISHGLCYPCKAFYYPS